MKASGTPAGLEYSAVPIVMTMFEVKKKRRADLFSGLQTMELEALRIWRKS